MSSLAPTAAPFFQCITALGSSSIFGSGGPFRLLSLPHGKAAHEARGASLQLLLAWVLSVVLRLGNFGRLSVRPYGSCRSHSYPCWLLCLGLLGASSHVASLFLLPLRRPVGLAPVELGGRRAPQGRRHRLEGSAYLLV